MRFNTPMFPLGQTVATPAALDRLSEAGETAEVYLRRHASKDWVDLDSDDKSENDEALLHGGRLLSAYILSSGKKIWIITEADRSSTTVLCPECY